MVHKKKVVLVFPSFKYPAWDILWGIAFLRSYLQTNLKNVLGDVIDTSFERSF